MVKLDTHGLPAGLLGTPHELSGATAVVDKSPATLASKPLKNVSCVLMILPCFRDREKAWRTQVHRFAPVFPSRAWARNKETGRRDIGRNKTLPPGRRSSRSMKGRRSDGYREGKACKFNFSARGNSRNWQWCAGEARAPAHNPRTAAETAPNQPADLCDGKLRTVLQIKAAR